jgi:hypothetical protein
MPTFEFTSPEGKSYEIEGPEGATQEQAFGILQQHLGAAPTKPAAPAAPPQKLVAGTNAGIPDAAPNRPDPAPPLYKYDSEKPTYLQRGLSALYDKLPYGVKDTLEKTLAASMGHQPEFGAMAENAAPGVQALQDKFNAGRGSMPGAVTPKPKLPDAVTKPSLLNRAWGRLAQLG